MMHTGCVVTLPRLSFLVELPVEVDGGVQIFFVAGVVEEVVELLHLGLVRRGEAQVWGHFRHLLLCLPTKDNQERFRDQQSCVKKRPKFSEKATKSHKVIKRDQV